MTRVDRNKTTSVLTGANGINNGMGLAPSIYVAPDPPLLVFGAQIVKLDKAEQLAGTRAAGAADARNVERSLLVGMIESQRGYVQKLMDAATPDKAAALATGAGMFLAQSPTHTKAELVLRLGTAPGSVDLDANATMLLGKTNKRAYYNWQWTNDGGKTFNNALSTPHASTTISGLTLLTTYGFRVCVTTGTATTPWSQVVSILVH